MTDEERNTLKRELLAELHEQFRHDLDDHMKTHAELPTRADVHDTRDALDRAGYGLMWLAERCGHTVEEMMAGIDHTAALEAARERAELDAFGPPAPDDDADLVDEDPDDQDDAEG
jgi:hypothetical protein